MASVAQIIGKINPKLYAANGKELLKKYGSSDRIPADEVKPQALRYISKDGFKITNLGLEASNKLVYDSISETLEPLYFFILDLANDFGMAPEKLVDNFTSTPGSGHFAELGMRATRMQEEGAKIMGSVNTVLRSVLNLIYDLREFRIRLEHYNHLKSSGSEKEAALLALKQIWLDRVDMTKGNTSVKALAFGQSGFQTLIDAFMVAKNVKDVDNIDLNDRVQRLLKARLQEFDIWLRESERELRKRYELEKTYLRSQVNSLKLYTRWVKPYLEMSAQMEQMSPGRSPDFIKTFNTILLQLTLLGKRSIDVKEAAVEGDLPRDFVNLKVKRKYYSCVLIDFKFRGIPNRFSQQQSHYVFGGRTEVVYAAYALNEDELKAIDYELDQSGLGEMLKFVEGATGESLTQLQEDIDSFLNETEEKSKESKDGSNPFVALFGGYEKRSSNDKSPKKTETKKEKVIVRKDDWIESEHLRRFAAEEASEATFNMFDIYKKAHGMASFT